MTSYLFVGPSLPEARQYVGDGIVLLPPVAAGDLLRLDVRPGDLVGIADGYFHQTRAVRHKEILHLIDKGATVLGAASMGALRAAELDVFGMLGVGGIYRDYRDGKLTGDDEVALLHGAAEDGYPAGSEPMVNLRATLELCVRERLLDAETADGFVAELANRAHRLRTYPDLIHLAHSANVPAERVEGLRDLFANRAVNRKREDTLRLVAVMHRMARLGAPARPRTDRAPTVYLHRWLLGARSFDDQDGPIAAMSVLRIHQLFAGDYPEFQRELVSAALARECAETCGGSSEDPLDAALAHARHRGVVPDLDSPAAGELDFLDQWLTPEERQTGSDRDRVAAFLVRSFLVAPGIPADGLAIDALGSKPVVSAAGRIVAAAAEVNEQARKRREAFDIHALSEDRILSYMAERWGVGAEDLELHALDRGFASLDVLVAAARPYYLLAKYNPDFVDLRVTGSSR
jgi:hypothetical protein